jgi:adenosylhomocysteine nucleosidase
MKNPIRVAILISANEEWRVIRELIPGITEEKSPLGEWFTLDLFCHGKMENVLFFHGGWGKIAASASTQYVIDRWNPGALINLGTCGGFEGLIDRGVIILAEKTIVYDIIEQMYDFQKAIDAYTTTIDLSWLKDDYPQSVLRTLLVSGDRDLVASQIPELTTRYAAVAGDWESGAIAYVTQLNSKRCLILRGVSDLVGNDGGEAYGKVDVFVEGTRGIFKQLLDHLPSWIELILS